MIPDVNLALVLLNTLLGFIANLRAQGGLTDDALAAQVQSVTQKNDAAYAALMAALNPTTPVVAAPAVPAIKKP
jgi:hypothetical protein